MTVTVHGTALIGGGAPPTTGTGYVQVRPTGLIAVEDGTMIPYPKRIQIAADGTWSVVCEALPEGTGYWFDFYVGGILTASSPRAVTGSGSVDFDALSTLVPDAGTEWVPAAAVADIIAASIPEVIAAATAALSNPTYNDMVYDAGGNLVSYVQAGVACTLTYNGDGTVHTLTTGDTTRTFTYDGSGRMTGAA